MNAFDSSILLGLNRFAQHSAAFNSAVAFVGESELLKGEPFMLLIWWYWYAPGERRAKNRPVILATLTAAFASILLGRSLALLLPFRVRPLFNPELGFVRPLGLDGEPNLRLWSAFPSDHAMLFASLATGMFFLSPPVGAAAYLYALAVVGLPRLYLGLHHPTDILGGALIGTAVAWAANRERVRRPLAERLLEFKRRRENVFYVLFFFLSVQIMTMFNQPRAVASELLKLLHRAH